MTSVLQLRQLSIFYGNKPVYSERFHSGVNIIHGDNGSGKSTITDIIFFVLGGDLDDWKDHAGRCSFVLAEIVGLDNSAITLRRDISATSGRPMQVFFGPYEDALVAGPAAWNLFPYRRPSSGLSFTQVLFRTLGIPEAISTGDSNITMHQLLRLLYGDQMTPVQRLFRQEDFDTWELREAVGHFLCGIGGEQLYQLKLTLRTLSKEFDQASQKLRSLMTVAASYGDDILIEHIEVAISKLSDQRSATSKRLDEILTQDLSSEENEIADKAIRTHTRELQRAKSEVANLEDRIETLDYEIQDSERFIKYLEQTLSEFDDAATTFFSLGHLRFEFCPSCFAPTKMPVPEGHCHLCGTEMPKSTKDGKSLAVRLDIEMQLRESRTLAVKRATDVAALRAALRIARAKLTSTFEAAELVRRGLTSKRDAAVAELSRQLGFLDSELAVLQRRVELSREIAAASAEKDELNRRMSRLKEQIEALETAQDRRSRIALTAVAEQTKHLLNQDLAEQSDLLPVKTVSFSFAQDWIAINGDKNRSGSASGMVILKNSLLVGLYLAALEDSQFLLPRFMVLDNIEDKGMVQERSWNFQRLIIKETESKAVPHQLIFTTSKISPELAESPYVVGRKYTKLHPTLEFS